MTVRDLPAINASLNASSGVLLLLGIGAADAGILRDVMASIGLGPPAPGTAKGPTKNALPRQGFACCNLHFDGDEINDANYSELPMIPAGTPITTSHLPASSVLRKKAPRCGNHV